MLDAADNVMSLAQKKMETLKKHFGFSERSWKVSLHEFFQGPGGKFLSFSVIFFISELRNYRLPTENGRMPR